ncbi:MAG TPA: hypothetical protein VFO38_04785 [Candidatus Saccharimonadales bacterium]|nr:hypothetical protein [Candidatus Saccharimonadales bacterium]
MRIRLVALGLAALALSACSSTEPQQTAPAATSATTTTTATPTPTSPVDMVAESIKDKAFAYYTSTERRQRIDAFLTNEGVRYAKLMESGEIPSRARGWASTTPPPRNGYGLLESVNGGNTVRPFLSVVVFFNNGKVDLNQQVLSVYIIKGNRSVDVDGRLVVKVDGTLLRDTPGAYGWRIDGSKDDNHGFMLDKRGRGSFDPELPLDPNRKYTVLSRKSIGVLVTETELRDADNMLFQLLGTEFAVNPSDWR